MTPLRVFIGWDGRESEAFDVASFSLRTRSSIPLDIVPIKLNQLRHDQIYWRDEDPLASTEFTYSRFLVPHLMAFDGVALYCDCDFLWLADVADLLALHDSRKAVQCVQHDYKPRETLKMDGKTQTAYPRKNWSSLMMFSCGHSDTRRLDLVTVNSATAAYLHRMHWAVDESIGALPPDWNWLEGSSAPTDPGGPRAVHFTRGGPWFEAWSGVDYAQNWRDERARMIAQEGKGLASLKS